MTISTIHDLIRLALPPGTRLLTHASGLIRPIQGAVSLRSTPPALPMLRGGELVIISQRDASAVDESLTVYSIVSRLATSPVGGLAITGAVDAETLAAAKAAKLPLLQLPAELEPRTLVREVMLLLQSPDIQIERRAAQLYSELTAAVARGEGIESVLKIVGTATGREVAFYDAGSQLRSEYSTPATASIFAELRPRKAMKARENGHVILVKTVGKGNDTGLANRVYGYIALCGPDIDRWDEAAAEQAAAALMLEVAKQHAVQAVESRVGGELLQGIVNGLPIDMTILQDQATDLGYDLRQVRVAVYIAPADGGITVSQIRERLDYELLLQRVSAPYVERDLGILCMYPIDEHHKYTKLQAMLQKLAQNLPVGAGISKPAPTASGWQQASTQADSAFTLGRYLFGPRNITRYDDLPVFRLLYEMRSLPELWQFYQTTLGALIDYDRRHNATLLQTLEGYFAAKGNLSQAAERLQIHRNTLLYRLRRVSEISGVDMERPEDTLALQVALKAHWVFQAGKSERQVVPT